MLINQPNLRFNTILFWKVTDPNFSPLIYGPSTKSINQRREMRICDFSMGHQDRGGKILLKISLLKSLRPFLCNQEIAAS